MNSYISNISMDGENDPFSCNRKGDSNWLEEMGIPTDRKKQHDNEPL